MKTFTDANGRSWTLTLNLGTATQGLALHILKVTQRVKHLRNWGINVLFAGKLHTVSAFTPCLGR